MKIANEELNRKINEATSNIARILGALERETGCLVNSIEITQVDISQLKDERPIYSCRVSLDMKRYPGHRWEI